MTYQCCNPGHRQLFRPTRRAQQQHMCVGTTFRQWVRGRETAGSSPRCSGGLSARGASKMQCFCQQAQVDNDCSVGVRWDIKWCWLKMKISFFMMLSKLLDKMKLYVPGRPSETKGLRMVWFGQYAKTSSMKCSVLQEVKALACSPLEYLPKQIFCLSPVLWTVTSWYWLSFTCMQLKTLSPPFSSLYILGYLTLYFFLAWPTCIPFHKRISAARKSISENSNLDALEEDEPPDLPYWMQPRWGWCSRNREWRTESCGSCTVVAWWRSLLSMRVRSVRILALNVFFVSCCVSPFYWVQPNQPLINDGLVACPNRRHAPRQVLWRPKALSALDPARISQAMLASSTQERPDLGTTSVDA